MAKAYVYMLRCADGSLYTGWTTCLAARLDAHNGKGKQGAKYTRSRRPVTPAYCEVLESAIEAQKREYAIKRLSHEQKEALINACSDLAERLLLFEAQKE